MTVCFIGSLVRENAIVDRRGGQLVSEVNHRVSLNETTATRSWRAEVKVGGGSVDPSAWSGTVEVTVPRETRRTDEDTR